MTYTALTDKYSMTEMITEPTEDNPEGEFIKHTWTEGNQYEVTIDKDARTIQVSSDAGTTQVTEVLNFNKFLARDVFGIDISNIINLQLADQKALIEEAYANA